MKVGKGKMVGVMTKDGGCILPIMQRGRSVGAKSQEWDQQWHKTRVQIIHF